VVLHQKPRSTSYIPQEVRHNNARQRDAAVPTVEMSTSQTHEAGTTRQPTQSASLAFSSGHSTTIESMASTGNLRRTETSTSKHLAYVRTPSTGDSLQCFSDPSSNTRLTFRGTCFNSAGVEICSYYYYRFKWGRTLFTPGSFHVHPYFGTFAAMHLLGELPDTQIHLQ